MKKIILVLCILSLTTTAYAACNGGTERGGFCVSNIALNWWSAAAWCQANGRTLATMYDVCPNWDGNTGSGKCPVLGGSGYGWTATVTLDDAAFYVRLSDGTVGYYGRDAYYYTICK